MSFGRYALGIASLGAVCGSLGLTAVLLRGRLLPAWEGAPARLAESVIGLAALTGILEALGAVGLFALGPIVLACVILGGAAALWVRRAGQAEPSGRGDDAERRPRAPFPAPAGAPLARAVALAAIGLVFAEWSVPTLHSYDVGIRAFDSLWYHLPWAASFAQTAHIAPLRFTDVEYLTPFYPANAELVHGLGIVLLGRDTLSAGLNLVFLGLSLLAAWCVGRPRGLGPATLTGAALALALPMARFSQAGSAANDVIGVFFLLASVALVLNAGGEERALVLAAVSAGLAISVKLSLLAPVGALSIAAVALVPEQRRRLAGRWAAALALAGGFWYLRNLIAVGNPLPWFSFGILPTPDPALQQHTAFSVAHYLTGAHVLWSRYFEPGLRDGLGRWWPVILAASVLGPLAGLRRGADRAVPALGLVAVASLLGYLLTPEGAAGPAGHPSGFAFNLRYAMPALTLTLSLLPLVVERHWVGERDRLRARAATIGGLALVLVATLADPKLWPGGYTAGGALLGLAAAGTAAGLGARRAAAASRPRDSRRAWLLVGGVGVVVGLAALAFGFAGQRHYLRGRYRFEPRVSSLATLWQWFRGIRSSRVALAGSFGGFFSYPLFGLEDSNRVQYVAHRGPHGSFTAIGACAEWRRTVNTGGYRYVVSTPGRDPWKPKRLSYSPEGDWTRSDPAARPVFHQDALGQRIVVYELRGPLDPSAC